MPLYEYKGPARPFMPGRPLEKLIIESVEVKSDRLTATGKLAYRDVLMGAAGRNQRFEIEWQATNESFGGSLSGWVVSRRSGFGMNISESVRTSLQDIVRREIEQFLERNPAVLAHCANHEEPEPVKENIRHNGDETAPPVVDTSFPSDWAIRHLPPPRVTRPVPPAPPLLPPLPPPVAPLVSPPVASPPVSVALPAPSLDPERFSVKRKGWPARVFRNVEVARPYSGPRERYAGPCVCEDIENSCPRQPFNWIDLTMAQYPDRCFECSCGTRWWCNRHKENYWIRVADDRAWTILCDYDGNPAAGTFAYEGNELYLLATLAGRSVPLPYSVHRE